MFLVSTALEPAANGGVTNENHFGSASQLSSGVLRLLDAFGNCLALF